MQDGGSLVPDVESLTGRAAIMAKQQAGGQLQGAVARGGAQGAAQGGAQSGAQGAEQHADQERPRKVSREGVTSAGTGMQRGARQEGAGSALAGRGQGQPSLLPAFMANPGLMASAFMSNPFAFAQAMSQEMDRLFSTYGGGEFASPFGQPSGGSQAGRGLTGGQQGLQQGMPLGGRGLAQWAPPVEVFQRGNELVVRADLPGLTPDDVQIEIEDGVLTVSGERRQEADERQEGFYRTERSYGAFSRSVALPEGVDEEQVQARFEHGVLEVTVPLPQRRQRGRRVQIRSGGAQSAGQQQVGQVNQQAGAESGREGSA